MLLKNFLKSPLELVVHLVVAKITLFCAFLFSDLVVKALRLLRKMSNVHES